MINTLLEFSLILGLIYILKHTFTVEETFLPIPIILITFLSKIAVHLSLALSFEKENLSLIF